MITLGWEKFPPQKLAIFRIVRYSLRQSLSIAIRTPIMKADIHPKYEEVIVTCSCGHTFKTGSTLGRKDLHLEICSECHPFYTGTQKLVDTSGRVEKFKQKYARKK